MIYDFKLLLIFDRKNFKPKTHYYLKVARTNIIFLKIYMFYDPRVLWLIM